MIVGQTMSGKTSILNTLQNGTNRLYESKQIQYTVEKVLINPKSVTMGELYGEENANQDWEDGLASHYIRTIS